MHNTILEMIPILSLRGHRHRRRVNSSHRTAFAFRELRGGAGRDGASYGDIDGPERKRAGRRQSIRHFLAVPSHSSSRYPRRLLSGRPARLFRALSTIVSSLRL